MQVIHKDLIVIDTCDSSWGKKECFVVTRYGQADIPTADWPRPLTSRGISAWPYRVTTSIPFIQYIHTRCWKKIVVKTVLWNEKSSDLTTNYLSILTHVQWCMPGLLTSGFHWSRRRGKRSQHSRCMRKAQFYVSAMRCMTLKHLGLALLTQVSFTTAMQTSNNFLTCLNIIFCLAKYPCLLVFFIFHGHSLESFLGFQNGWQHSRQPLRCRVIKWLSARSDFNQETG